MVWYASEKNNIDWGGSQGQYAFISGAYNIVYTRWKGHNCFISSNKTKLFSGPALQVHTFNVRTVKFKYTGMKSDMKLHPNFNMYYTVGDVTISKLNPQKYIKYYQMCTNIGCTSSIIIQSLNIKEWNLLELQITQPETI